MSPIISLFLLSSYLLARSSYLELNPHLLSLSSSLFFLLSPPSLLGFLSLLLTSLLFILESCLCLTSPSCFDAPPLPGKRLLDTALSLLE